MEEVMTLTAKQARVLEIMRESGEPMFASDIAELDTELFTSGSRSVTPLVEGLFKKGLVNKGEGEHNVFDVKANKEVVKTHKLYSLTDEGVSAIYETKA